MARSCTAAPARLLGFSNGGEDALLMAAFEPGIARSVVAWGASGSLSDPDGKLRQVMYNFVDHPQPQICAMGAVGG